MNFKVAHLSQEINHLQKLFREENDINESIRHEVTRLTSENMVWFQPWGPGYGHYSRGVIHLWNKIQALGSEWLCQNYIF